MARKGKRRNEKKRNDVEIEQPVKLPDLPEEAVTEILLRFPVKSVLRFRCVSKKWCTQIDSLQFRKKHHSYRRLARPRYDDEEDDEFLVVNRKDALSGYDDYKSLSELKSSCDLDINDSMYFSSFSYSINGIVCVVRDVAGGLKYYLCNPALREILQLPKFPRFPVRFGVRRRFFTSAVGIGFDDAADDYAVVQFVHDGGDSDAYDLKCVSYHVKTESWTMIEMPPALVSAYSYALKKRCGSFYKLYASFFSHGCIHWCMHWCRMILTLNTNTKSFHEIEFPHGWKDYGYRDYAYLLNFDSSSSIALFGTHGHKIDIWVMKEYGVADSWTKQYVISDHTIPGLAPSIHGLPRISRPLCFWRKDKVFLLTVWGKLVCYDLGKGRPYDPPLRGQCERLPYPNIKALEVVTSSGEKKLLLVPDMDYESPRRGQGRPSSLPHSDMKTLEMITCSGSLVSLHQKSRRRSISYYMKQRGWCLSPKFPLSGVLNMQNVTRLGMYAIVSLLLFTFVDPITLTFLVLMFLGLHWLKE